MSGILRYVGSDNFVKERQFALLNDEKSTENYYLQLLKDLLESEGTEFISFIGDVTKDASNMQGFYNVFSALQKKVLPTHVHTWCYAHVLNLAMDDITGNIRQSTKLFKLLNYVAGFFQTMLQGNETMRAYRKHNQTPGC